MAADEGDRWSDMDVWAGYKEFNIKKQPIFEGCGNHSIQEYNQHSRSIIWKLE